MKLLVTGANGQLGRCLTDRASVLDRFEFIALSSSDLDITNRDAVFESIVGTKPDVVINAAAYTAVDAAEDEEDVAFSVNAQGVKNLAEACLEASIPLIHISTDYVFDGKAHEPYAPESPTAPMGVYGKSKLQGESVAQKVLDRLVVLRTAWVYSEYGSNFVKTMLRSSENRDELSVVGDQIGCPTYAGNIASVILEICVGINKGSASWGVYHYVDDKDMSWHEFSEKIFAMAKEYGLVNKDILVHEISTEEYPTAAGRPAYSVLDTEALQRDYDVKQFGLDESLSYVLNRLVAW